MIVLVTGAAGLLGGAVAAALLDRGHGVIGVVHRENDIRGNGGDLLPAREMGDEPPRAGELVAVKGDVTRPVLGLDDRAVSLLAGHVDCIVHCAAMVRFEAALEELEAVNVAGTLNAAQLCAGARFIHVSTAYVCGKVDGPVAEGPADPCADYANGYEQSKAMAEAALIAARPDAVVARPSVVVGEQETGRIRAFDTIYRAFKFVAEGRIAAVPAGSEATLNFVPIDHVVAGLVDLVETAVTGPRYVHLAAQQGIAARRFLGVIGTMPGLVAPQIIDPAMRDAPSGLADRLAQPYWSYFDRSPQFDTAALEKISGRVAPVMDEEAFRRQIAFCVDAGFIKPRG